MCCGTIPRASSPISPPGAPSVRFRCLPPLPLSQWPLPVPAGSSLRGWTCCSTMMPVPLPIVLPSLILKTFHAERHIPAASRSARSTVMPVSAPPRPTFPTRCSAISPAYSDQPVRPEMAGSIPVLQSCPHSLAMVSSAAGCFCKHSVIRELRKGCDLFGML